MKKLKLALIIAAIAIGAAIFYITGEEATPLSGEITSHELFSIYGQNFEYKPLSGAVADFDGDGKTDLLIIFSYTKDSNKMVVILNKDTPAITQILPAPLENIAIELKDIDHSPPVEFIISGSKNNNFGYGIYRIEAGEIFDIFGADMRDCC